jgi:hypothetical protein
MADLALKTLPAAIVTRLWRPFGEVELSRMISVIGQSKRLGAHVGINQFVVRVLVCEATRASKSNAAGAGAFSETLLNDLAMNTHAATISTGLNRDFHAVNPSGKVCKVKRAHHSRVYRSIRDAHRELSVRLGEVLEAGEGVFVILGLGKGQVYVVRTGFEITEVDAILDQLMGSSVEIEELVHLFDRSHSPEGRRGNVTGGLPRAQETGAANTVATRC